MGSVRSGMENTERRNPRPRFPQPQSYPNSCISTQIDIRLLTERNTCCGTATFYLSRLTTTYNSLLPQSSTGSSFTNRCSQRALSNPEKMPSPAYAKSPTTFHCLKTRQQWTANSQYYACRVHRMGVLSAWVRHISEMA
jgi:hypothetical protein